MIPDLQKKKMLMIVKTYPTPSIKYGETVCTAGITDEGEWIRLYPLRYRRLNKNQQFNKYTWIEATVYRNPKDLRVESYKIDESTLKVLNKLDAKKDMDERKKWILPLCKNSLEEVIESHQQFNTSLGIFQPKEVLDLVITPADKNWSSEQEMCLNQMGLFEDQNIVKLQKVPWDFSFKFTCNNGCKSVHKLKITDWEIYQTYRNFKKYYGDEKVALKKLSEKWMNYFNNDNKDSYFIVGTVHPWPTFIILGVVSYSKQKVNKEKIKTSSKVNNPIEGQITFI